MSRGYYTPPKHYDSQNYIWSNKDQLGSGAGGTVYVGYCKKDGMKVAVKEFKQSNYITVHQQEIEVLKALPTHRNIVRLFAAENESVKHHPVLVMELCTGKSLYEVIESPQNAYGLCEEEFKTMMIDTTEGLAHLRRHNVIHRDIKPGNIMRCRNHDGSYTYKLTDFGAARELAEGDRFVSLYGTEEYLHPDVYEKALVNTGKKAQFTAKVDLWSIGATLYHAATGRLPFQSYNQRKDRHTMFQIISRKDKGIISGVQRTSQGQIDWSSHLPEDTRISKGLKLLLEPILQGVLETDVSYMMDFDHYFERVKSIGRMKVFDVFVVSKCECIKVYIHPRDQRPYASLKRSVCEQCGIKDERYMDLYFDNLPLAVVDQTSVEKLPQTTEDRPIFVYGGQVEEHLKSIAMRQVPRQPDPKDLKQAIQFAKECHKLIYYQKHVTTMLNRKFAMMHQAASCMSHMLKKDQEMMSTLFQNVSTAYSSIRTQLFHFIGSLWQLRELLTAVNPQVQGSLTDFIQNIAEDKQSKEREVKLLEERYEPVSMKVQSIQELARRGISDDWDPNYLSESFAKSMDTINHQCTEAGEEAEVVITLAKSVHMHQSNPVYSYEMKVLGFTKDHLHKRLLETQDKLQAWNNALTALHRRLHHWLNATVVTHNETTSLHRALQKEQWKYGEDSKQLQEWMSQSDSKLKDMAQQIAVVFQNHVDVIQRQASMGSQVTARTPNTPFSIQREEMAHMLQQVEQLTASLNVSRDSIRQNADIVQRSADMILEEVGGSHS